jgi:hypothetical protein
MAWGLLFLSDIMQIPYDLEFVENRPTVTVRALAMNESFPAWRSEPNNRKDIFDALLAWMHRMVRRLEKN